MDFPLTWIGLDSKSNEFNFFFFFANLLPFQSRKIVSPSKFAHQSSLLLKNVVKNIFLPRLFAIKQDLEEKYSWSILNKPKVAALSLTGISTPCVPLKMFIQWAQGRKNKSAYEDVYYCLLQFPFLAIRCNNNMEALCIFNSCIVHLIII